MKSHTTGLKEQWTESYGGRHGRLSMPRTLPQIDIGAGASHHPCETLFQAEEMVEVEWRRKKNHAYNWTKINAATYVLFSVFSPEKIFTIFTCF